MGRNFMKKEEILSLLDAMSMYKLNKFHFHLTDDEGWRLEIPGLPELTEVGGSRSCAVGGRGGEGVVARAWGRGLSSDSAIWVDYFRQLLTIRRDTSSKGHKFCFDPIHPRHL